MALKSTLAVVLDTFGLLDLLRFIRTRILRRRAIIVLCYHRITDTAGLIAPQCIPAPEFDQHLVLFRKHFSVVGIDRIEKMLSGFEKPDSDVLGITFDDGYEDNYYAAAPLLRKHGLTAAFFIASDPILHGKGYWIDALSCLLESIAVNQVECRIDDQRIDELLHRLRFAPDSGRRGIAREIFGEFMHRSDEDRIRLLEALRQRCRNIDLTARTPGLMSPEQIAELIAEGHIIGAHTVSHPRLSTMTSARAEAEFVAGITALRERFGNISFFAYPFGKASDLPIDIASFERVLDENRVLGAYTTIDGAVRLPARRFHIPRKVMSRQTLPQIKLKLEMMSWGR